jgi:hypothetical protein
MNIINTIEESLNKESVYRRFSINTTHILKNSPLISSILLSNTSSLTCPSRISSNDKCKHACKW